MVDRIPSKSLQTITTFLTYLEAAKRNPETPPQFWTQLQNFLQELQPVEDSQPRLASFIKNWCSQHEITLDDNAYPEIRANIIQKQQQSQPDNPNLAQLPEGDKPILTANKALITRQVEQTLDKNANES